MLNLAARIETAAAGNGNVTFVDGDSYDTITWAELHADARTMAAGLRELGVRAGDHIGVFGPTTRSLVTAIQATWLTGGVLTMLPLPMRLGSIDQFVAQTRHRLRVADVSLVIVDPQLVEFVQPEPGDPRFVTYADVVGAVDDSTASQFVVANPDPDSLAVLQFTSGSTSEPKGVALTHRQICANIDGCYEASEMTADDVLVSWLPLYHDMGLIGLLGLPMTTGVHLVLGAPQDFLSKPLRWLRWISDFGGTTTAGPNFAYVLATRALRRAEDLDLSSLEIVLSGAEPVDAAAFQRFFDAGARFGLKPQAAFPAFGMAEVCIGGTFPSRGAGLRTDIVNARLLETEQIAVPVAADDPEARVLVRLGRAVPGLELRVVDPMTGTRRVDREVGELQIRGNSLMAGYYRRDDATAEAFVDGWLHSGDLAYLIDGELVMCGRIKDVIIVGGRNVYPQDIERAVGAVDGVRTGNVVAFAADGRNSQQHIVVVAETKSDEPVELSRAIHRAVADETGVPPRDVLLVAPGTVPKTSSGKLQRSATRQAYEAGELVGVSGP